MNETEKKSVSKMIALYCEKHHASAKNQLCESCKKLEAYAHKRLERCIYGNDKGTCGSCPTHCYQKEMKTNIQNVMRYAGPLMVWKHPIYALDHLYKAIFKRKKKTPRANKK